MRVLLLSLYISLCIGFADLDESFVPQVFPFFSSFQTWSLSFEMPRFLIKMAILPSKNSSKVFGEVCPSYAESNSSVCVKLDTQAKAIPPTVKLNLNIFCEQVPCRFSVLVDSLERLESVQSCGRKEGETAFRYEDKNETINVDIVNGVGRMRFSSSVDGMFSFDSYSLSVLPLHISLRNTDCRILDKTRNGLLKEIKIARDKEYLLVFSTEKQENTTRQISIEKKELEVLTMPESGVLSLQAFRKEIMVVLEHPTNITFAAGAVSGSVSIFDMEGTLLQTLVCSRYSGSCPGYAFVELSAFYIRHVAEELFILTEQAASITYPIKSRLLDARPYLVRFDQEIPKEFFFGGCCSSSCKLVVSDGRSQTFPTSCTIKGLNSSVSIWLHLNYAANVWTFEPCSKSIARETLDINDRLFGQWVEDEFIGSSSETEMLHNSISTYHFVDFRVMHSECKAWKSNAVRIVDLDKCEDITFEPLLFNRTYRAFLILYHNQKFFWLNCFSCHDGVIVPPAFIFESFSSFVLFTADASSRFYGRQFSVFDSNCNDMKIGERGFVDFVESQTYYISPLNNNVLSNTTVCGMENVNVTILNENAVIFLNRFDIYNVKDCTSRYCSNGCSVEQGDIYASPAKPILWPSINYTLSENTLFPVNLTFPCHVKFAHEGWYAIYATSGGSYFSFYEEHYVSRADQVLHFYKLQNGRKLEEREFNITFLNLTQVTHMTIPSAIDDIVHPYLDMGPDNSQVLISLSNHEYDWYNISHWISGAVRDFTGAVFPDSSYFGTLRSPLNLRTDVVKYISTELLSLNFTLNPYEVEPLIEGVLEEGDHYYVFQPFSSDYYMFSQDSGIQWIRSYASMSDISLCQNITYSVLDPSMQYIISKTGENVSHFTSMSNTLPVVNVTVFSNNTIHWSGESIATIQMRKSQYFVLNATGWIVRGADRVSFIFSSPYVYKRPYVYKSTHEQVIVSPVPTLVHRNASGQLMLGDSDPLIEVNETVTNNQDLYINRRFIAPKSGLYRTGQTCLTLRNNSISYRIQFFLDIGEEIKLSCWQQLSVSQNLASLEVVDMSGTVMSINHRSFILKFPLSYKGQTFEIWGSVNVQDEKGEFLDRPFHIEENFVFIVTDRFSMQHNVVVTSMPQNFDILEQGSNFTVQNLNPGSIILLRLSFEKIGAYALTCPYDVSLSSPHGVRPIDIRHPFLLLVEEEKKTLEVNATRRHDAGFSCEMSNVTNFVWNDAPIRISSYSHYFIAHNLTKGKLYKTYGNFELFGWRNLVRKSNSFEVYRTSNASGVIFGKFHSILLTSCDFAYEMLTSFPAFLDTSFFYRRIGVRISKGQSVFVNGIEQSLEDNECGRSQSTEDNSTLYFVLPPQSERTKIEVGTIPQISWNSDNPSLTIESSFGGFSKNVMVRFTAKESNRYEFQGDCEFHVLNATQDARKFELRKNDVFLIKVIRSYSNSVTLIVLMDRTCSSIPDLVVQENENEPITWKRHSVSSTYEVRLVKFVPAYTGEYSIGYVRHFFVKDPKLGCVELFSGSNYYGLYGMEKGKEYLVNLQSNQFFYGYKGFDCEHVDRNVDITLDSLDQLGDDNTFSVPPAIPGRTIYSWNALSVVVKWDIETLSVTRLDGYYRTIFKCSISHKNNTSSSALTPGDVFVMYKYDHVRFSGFVWNDFPPFGTPNSMFVVSGSNRYSCSDEACGSIERALQQAQRQQNVTIYVSPGKFELQSRTTVYSQLYNISIVAKYASFKCYRSQTGLSFKDSIVHTDGLHFTDCETAFEIQKNSELNSALSITNTKFTRVQNVVKAVGISSLKMENITLSEVTSSGIQSDQTNTVSIKNVVVENSTVVGSFLQIQQSNHVEIDGIYATYNNTGLCSGHFIGVNTAQNVDMNNVKIAGLGGIAFESVTNGKISHLDIDRTCGLGLDVVEPENVVIENSSFKNAMAGGAEVAAANNGGNVTFKRCVFQSNGKKALEISGGGGGLNIAGLKNVTLIDCRFISNSVSENGGAISFSGGELHLRSCEFDSNRAGQFGGAIYVKSGKVEGKETVFKSNAANDCGDEIFATEEGKVNIESEKAMRDCDDENVEEGEQCCKKETSKPGTRIDTFFVLGIVAALLALILIVVLITIYVKRRRRRGRNVSDSENDVEEFKMEEIRPKAPIEAPTSMKVTISEEDLEGQNLLEDDD